MLEPVSAVAAKHETMKIAVTGATGYIGGRLVPRLLAEGHEIVLMEKDPRAAEGIRDELGAVVVNRDGCEGTHLAEAGANRAAIVAAAGGYVTITSSLRKQWAITVTCASSNALLAHINPISE